MQSLVIRGRVINRFLRAAAKDGWNEATLTKALKAENAPKSVLFADGIYSIAEAVMLGNPGDNSGGNSFANFTKVRDKISAAVNAHLRTLTKNKKAVAKMGGWLLLPQNLTKAAGLFYRVADEIWRECGLHSADFSFYTRRLSLATVYALTFYAWLGEDDPHENEAFLARRIDGLLRLFANRKRS